MNTLKETLSNNQFESVKILKELANAHRYLGELKGLCQSIPNQAILIETLSLQEAQDSSAIENIITTQDELFKYRLQENSSKNLAAKEVHQYSDALNFLWKRLGKNNLMTINNITEAVQIIKNNQSGVRKLTGTVIANAKTGETVYTPPEPNQLTGLLTDLEQFINDSNDSDLDPLIKMAIIHHQFESIHPYNDGNGRIGRIINVVYLVQQGLIELPVLYLSRYINHNKEAYYSLLQAVRDHNSWQAWVIYMLRAVSATAQSTIQLITDIKNLQQSYKQKIRQEQNKIYSQDLINNIFKHPYTKIAFLQQDLQLSRDTASRYLEQLVKSKLLTKQKIGRENYYINFELVKLLIAPTDLSDDR